LPPVISPSKAAELGEEERERKERGHAGEKK
jgi:hypothetical protein